MAYRDIFGNPVDLTDERWRHIITQHPEVAVCLERLGEVLLIVAQLAKLIITRFTPIPSAGFRQAQPKAQEKPSLGFDKLNPSPIEG